MVQCAPLLDVRQRARREAAVYDACVNLHRHLVFAISGVEMRRAVIPIVHRNHYTEEPGQLRHDSSLWGIIGLQSIALLQRAEPDPYVARHGHRATATNARKLSPAKLVARGHGKLPSAIVE